MDGIRAEERGFGGGEWQTGRSCGVRIAVGRAGDALERHAGGGRQEQIRYCVQSGVDIGRIEGHDDGCVRQVGAGAAMACFDGHRSGL